MMAISTAPRETSLVVVVAASSNAAHEGIQFVLVPLKFPLRSPAARWALFCTAHNDQRAACGLFSVPRTTANVRPVRCFLYRAQRPTCGLCAHTALRIRKCVRGAGLCNRLRCS